MSQRYTVVCEECERVVERTSPQTYCSAKCRSVAVGRRRARNNAIISVMTEEEIESFLARLPAVAPGSEVTP